MAQVSNYNAISFAHFLLPECYITMTVSMAFFTLLFVLKYYILMPKFIHSHFDHIKTNPCLHWKIADTSVSMIHGILVLVLCLIFNDVLFLSVTPNVTDSLTTFEERAIASLSIGYFIYDLIVGCVIFNKKHTGEVHYIYILHHIVSICGLSVCVITVYSGRCCVMALFLSEISNPLLHANGLRNKFTTLQSQNMDKHFIIRNILLKLLYIIMFCVARFIILGHIVFQIMVVFDCSVYIQIVGILLLALSIVLLPSLFKDLSKTYRKYKDVANPNNLVAGASTAIEDKIESYDDVLALCKKSVLQFFVAGTVYSFFHTTRMAIYVLYAEGFNPTPSQLALLLYGFNFWNGVASLLYSALANQYGYDAVLTLLLLLQSTAVLLESIAQSFYVLFVGAMLSQVAITYIVFGYIAWILPHQHAATYTSYFYGAFMLSYLIGPACAGFVSFYLSYRTVFVVTCVMCFCALIHSLLCIFKTQKKLESKQLLIGLMGDEEDDKQFPICLHTIATRAAGEDTNNKWYTLPTLSCHEWFMLLSMILINSSVSIGESAFVIYYSLYVVEELHGNVIIGTCGVVVMAIGFIIGNLIVPKWFKSITDESFFRNKYFAVILCLVILILHTLYLFPFIPSLSLYWLFDFTIGLPLGILSMSTELIVLEMQPTKESGKVSGVKGFIRNLMIAVTLFIIAMFYDREPNSFYFVVASSFGVALLLIMAMLIKKQINDIE